MAGSITQADIPGYVESDPRFSAKPSTVITVGPSDTVQLFDIEDDNRFSEISVENVGDEAVKIKADTARDEGDASAASFDSVISGGSADLDGLGGSLRYSLAKKIQRLTVYNHSATTASLVLKLWHSDQPWKAQQ
tara:strand:- start:1836 stop:2240 length:405 start_codon:yes stop_codon:yes gene_type:complete